jgi:hypothetical protein
MSLNGLKFHEPVKQGLDADEPGVPVDPAADMMRLFRCILFQQASHRRLLLFL